MKKAIDAQVRRAEQKKLERSKPLQARADCKLCSGLGIAPITALQPHLRWCPCTERSADAESASDARESVSALEAQRR